MAQYCEQCGSKNNDNNSFCNTCGYPLDNTNPAKPTSPEEPQQESGLTNEYGDDVDYAPEKSKRSKWIWILVGILFLAVVAAGSYWFFFMRKDTSSEITIVQMPQYSVKAGTYSDTQTVELSSGTPDAKIYYTTDGETPSENSTEYTKPITVDKSMTIKSIAINEKGIKSNIASADYKIGKEEPTTATDQEDNSAGGNSVDNNSSKVQMINTRISAGDWPFPGMGSFTATASSVHPVDNGITYYAENVLDGNTRTAWVENVNGTGEGQTITLTYTGSTPYTINQIDFINGYAKSDTVFNSNSTPTQVDVSVNGSQVATINLQVTATPQVADLTSPITLNTNDRITFTINQVSVGPADDLYDTAITEIAFK